MNSKQTPTDFLGTRGREIITAKLTMVDLTGSKPMPVSGVRSQKESIRINKDLDVLSNVITSLAEQQDPVKLKQRKIQVP